MLTDYLVVGSGITGATIARNLADAGKQVTVVERRSHIGGNSYDYTLNGIPVHKYGPHIFRTNNKTLWEYVKRFAKFYRYEHFVETFIDGRYENWPILGSYIERKIGKWTPEFTGVPRNFEEKCLSIMPRKVYDQFIKDYNRKMWGIPAKKLDADLINRFDIRWDEDKRMKQERYQGIPYRGWTAFFEKMLEGIPVILNYDYLKNNSLRVMEKTFYTGPIDEYFGFKLGKLGYRAVKQDTKFTPNVELTQPAPVINYPSGNVRQVRSVEWKQMMPDGGRSIKGSVVTSEIPYTPKDPDNYQYPFPDEKNHSLYLKYEEEASKDKGVVFCGRLGEYRYMDMDTAMDNALKLVEEYVK